MAHIGSVFASTAYLVPQRDGRFQPVHLGRFRHSHGFSLTLCPLPCWRSREYYSFHVSISGSFRIHHVGLVILFLCFAPWFFWFIHFRALSLFTNDCGTRAHPSSDQTQIIVFSMFCWFLFPLLLLFRSLLFLWVLFAWLKPFSSIGSRAWSVVLSPLLWFSDASGGRLPHTSFCGIDHHERRTPSPRTE